MTRFALIPLAFFANACASAEEVQDLVEETTEEVREGIDDIDYSRSLDAELLLDVAQDQFQKQLDIGDCTMVGAVAGKITGPTAINMVLVNAGSREVMARLNGWMSQDTNDGGGFYAQDTAMSAFNSVEFDGDWEHNAIEADVYSTQGRTIYEATLFATMTERGDASSILGVVAVCD